MLTKILMNLSLFCAVYTTPLFAQSPQIEKIDFITGLTSPWDMAFTAEGDLFYTEKCKGLSVKTANGDTQFLFGRTGANWVAEDFFCQGQSGMHGVALDPDFTNNFTLYLYMPSDLNDPATNRVVRIKLSSDYLQVEDRVDIVTDIPFKSVANNWGQAGSHSGGRLRFGPDGFLYITTGDNHDGIIPQLLISLGGKVLKVDPNGNPAPDSSFSTDGDPRVFTFGHRNVQGIDFHPVTGQPIVAEHGPGHSDEITPLVEGGNGGWDPQPETGVSCDDDYCGYTSNNIEGIPTSMTDLEKFPKAMLPILSNDDSQGMGPLTFLTGEQWKDWNGAIAVGIMGGERLDIIKVDDALAVQNVEDANLPAERLRSLVQGPDGNLYIATDSGSIWKVTPK